MISAYGNLFQVRQNVSFTTASHVFKAGAEMRLNRDTTYFGISPNGEYDFGGGTASSPINIPSQSGLHNISVGDPLPDTLCGLLSGSPFVYTVAVAPPYFSGGEHIGAAAINRNAFAFFAQDTWKISPRLVLDYGLRYELYTPISERAKRPPASLIPTPLRGRATVRHQSSAGLIASISMAWGRASQLDWLAGRADPLRAAGAITTIPPNIFQDNSATGSIPFADRSPPHLRSRGAYSVWLPDHVERDAPCLHAPGAEDFRQRHQGRSCQHRHGCGSLQQDLAALSPAHLITPLTINSIDPKFGNAYLQTWTLGLERHFGNLVADATYIGTAADKLPRMSFFNGYSGCGPELCSLYPV